MSKPSLGFDDVLDAGAARNNLEKPLDNGKKPRKVEGPTARLSLILPEELVQDLRMARVRDGITTLARVRALITLWKTDADVRSAADNLARKF